MTDSNKSQILGRRDYDVEITKLEYQIQDLNREVKELSADIKDLVDAWNNAKGLTAFIKWVGSLVVTVVAITAAIKGWKL